MKNTICMAVVSCANTTRGFTDKASYTEFIKAYAGSTNDQVLLILQGGAGATASLKTAQRMDWMKNRSESGNTAETAIIPRCCMSS